jgi:hypothetical protein
MINYILSLLYDDINIYQSSINIFNASNKNKLNESNHLNKNIVSLKQETKDKQR